MIEHRDIVRDWKLDYYEGVILKCVLDNTEGSLTLALRVMKDAPGSINPRVFNKMTLTAEDVLRDHKDLGDHLELMVCSFEKAIKTNCIILYRTYLKRCKINIVEKLKFIREN